MSYKHNIIKYINHIITRWSSLHTIILGFVFLYIILISKLFSYTFFDHEFYQALADKQQTGKFVVPVNRGMIYSSIEREDGEIHKVSVLGTSVNFYDLAIDPKMKGDKVKLLEFLVDLAYDESCEKQTFDKCKENILKIVRKSEIEDFENTEAYMKKILKKYIASKITKTKLESVSLGNEFLSVQLEELKALHIRGVYVVNETVYINPEEFSQTETNLKNISKILLINEERLKLLTKRRDLRYIPILKKLSIDHYENVKSYREEEQGAMRRGILDVKDSISKFFILEPKASRYYPEKTIASQIVGFVDGEGVGHYGLEGYFNKLLKGNSGKIVGKKDIKGNIITTTSGEKEDWRGEGIEIITTIDRNIQDKVETILEKGVKRYRANKGTIIVMEPDTGKVLTIANYPNYDLNNYPDVYELEKVDRERYPNPIDLAGYPVFVEDTIEGKKYIYDNEKIFLRDATEEEIADETLIKYKYKNGYGGGVYQNDAVSSIYEPGSIMKSITVAIGLDTGEITQYSKYNDVNFLKIDNFPIRNVDEEACGGYNTFGNALNFSCNVGMVRIFQRVGKALSHQYFKDFGFSDMTGIELDGEIAAELRPWEKISKSNLFTRSYGLGVSVTPLQMASAYSVLANGGILMKPKIIEKIVYSDGRQQLFKPEKVRRVIKESTSKTITKMLYNSAELGFAKTGNVEGYNVAGKTGTAEMVYKGTYRGDAGWTNASYAGYGPVEDPKFVIIVKLERPRTSKYGSKTSAILFKEVAGYLFDYFEIPKK